MAPRVCLPGELFLDAMVVDPRRQPPCSERPGRGAGLGARGGP